jgi:hypothetical protein
MENVHKDLVGYALKVWFTTLVLAPLNYFLIIIYLLPEARTLTQAEGFTQSFYVWIACLWGYFPTLLFFLIIQNLLKNRLPVSQGARILLVLAVTLFSAINIFVAGNLNGFSSLIWCASINCQLAFIAAFSVILMLASYYFLPWE